MAFRDKYTDFTFDDKKSSSYKVWITNKNDLQLALTPNFKDKFTSPQFGGVRYLDGTTIEKTDIKFSCIAIDVTLNEWRAICNWLSPTKIGKLSFDFNNNTYYNVKLSSTVTAKMFNYGGKDSLLGGRKVIEFSLSFTTVGDYAAMGPINTGQIDYERDTTVNTTNIVNELISRSMNHYHVPCIYSDTTEIKPNDNITGLDLLLDKDKSSLFKWYSADGSTHQMEYNTTTQKWNYVVSNTANTSEIYYSANHEEDYISVMQQKSTMDTMTGTAQKLDVDRTGFNIFNIGEYEAYPRIMLNNVSNNFEVWLDDTLYYKYEIRDGRELNNIVIDCQSGTVTYNGRFIENTTDAFGYTLIKSSYNLGPLSIPSGYPEVHKAKLDTATNSILTLTLAEPLMENYTDNINLGVTITRNIKNSVNYGEGLYDSNYYEPHMVGNHTLSGLTDESFYFTDVHAYIEPNNTTDSRKIKIYTTPNKISAAWSSSNNTWSNYALATNLDKDKIFYISFCEGHRLTIKVNDDVPTQSFISMQSRGAI